MSANRTPAGVTAQNRTIIRVVKILAGVGAATAVALSFAGNQIAAGLALLTIPPVVLVMVWRFAAGIWQRQGHGAVARHLGGAAAGLFAGFLVMAVIIAPYVETPPPAQPEQAPPQTAPAVESRPQAEQSASPAIEQPPPATAAQAPAMPAQQTHVVEQVPIEPKAQQSEPPPAKEISEPAEPAKPTLGLTPEQFRTRLNAVVRQIDESWTQAEFTTDEGSVNDVFTRKLTKHISMLGAISKKDGNLISLTLFLAGIEDAELPKAIAFSLAATHAANKSVSKEKSANALSAMMKRGEGENVTRLSEERRVGDAKYTVISNELVGLMIVVEPFEKPSK